MRSINTQCICKFIKKRVRHLRLLQAHVLELPAQLRVAAFDRVRCERPRRTDEPNQRGAAGDLLPQRLQNGAQEGHLLLHVDHSADCVDVLLRGDGVLDLRPLAWHDREVNAQCRQRSQDIYPPQFIQLQPTEVIS